EGHATDDADTGYAGVDAGYAEVQAVPLADDPVDGGPERVLHPVPHARRGRPDPAWNTGHEGDQGVPAAGDPAGCLSGFVDAPAPRGDKESDEVMHEPWADSLSRRLDTAPAPMPQLLEPGGFGGYPDDGRDQGDNGQDDQADGVGPQLQVKDGLNNRPHLD